MRKRRRWSRLWMVPLAIVGVAGEARAGDVVLPLDAEGPGWQRVRVVHDGASGSAASFGDPEARIDAGPCPVASTEPFTLFASIRTREPGFSTALMARGGGAVGIALVTGREPGKVSFEAWSWESVRLLSKTRVDDGKWHRIEVPYDPASRHALLFVDGRVEAWGDLGAGGAPAAELRLGNNIGADQPFRGDLDDVRVLRKTTHAERFEPLATVLSREDLLASLAALRDRVLPRSTKMPADAAAWAKRRDAIRNGIADALGLSPAPPAGPLEPRVGGKVEGDGFTVERLSWASFPGARATGWLWTPRPAREGRRPAILSPHGHWAGGAIDAVEQARAASYARQGYVALVPDSLHVEDVAGGVSALGAMTWNNLRGLALLLERDDVDPTKVGVTGASGGALQAIYLMALSDRLAAAAPICMVSYFERILADESAHCTCNHAPRVASVADEPETCAVFAPRPAFFGSVTGDWTHDFPQRGWPEIRGFYRLFGHEDRVFAMHRNEGHNYDRGFREAVYGFFRREMLGEKGDVAEAPFTPVSFEALRLIAARDPEPLDPAALAREFVARRPHVADLREVAPALPWKVERAPITELGAVAPGSPWHKATVTGADGVTIPMLLRPGPDPPRGAQRSWYLATAPEGMAAFLLDPPPWIQGVPAVALVEPRFSGPWAPFAAAWRRNGILLGRGEGYETAHDLALACESLRGSGPVTLVAMGSSGVPALLAARLSPRIRVVVAPDLGPRFSDDGNRLPLCPEILRFGDLPALAASVPGPRRLVLGRARPTTDFRAADGVTLDLSADPLTPAAVSAAVLASPRDGPAPR